MKRTLLYSAANGGYRVCDKMYCPCCRTIMHVNVTPSDFGPMYDLFSWECPKCGIWIDVDNAKESKKVIYCWSEDLHE